MGEWGAGSWSNHSSSTPPSPPQGHGTFRAGRGASSPLLLAEPSSSSLLELGPAMRYLGGRGGTQASASQEPADARGRASGPTNLLCSANPHQPSCPGAKHPLSALQGETTHCRKGR